MSDMRENQLKEIRNIEFHPEFQAQADQQMDADREWFIKHPFATQYFRKPYEFEIAQFQISDPTLKLKKILVKKTEIEGVRARVPIFES
jgi:hypothetical protein